jgi:hypothetical protein
LAQVLDKDKAKERLLGDAKTFLERAEDKVTIEANWRFIYSEALFPGALVPNFRAEHQ